MNISNTSLHREGKKQISLCHKSVDISISPDTLASGLNVLMKRHKHPMTET